MKFTTSRDDFLALLQTVSHAVSTRGDSSLAGVLIEAAGERAKLSATDREIGLQVEVAGTVEQEGSAVLPGRLLVEIVRLLPENTVSLELRAQQRDMEIVSGRASFHVKALPAEDFPKLPQPEAGGVVLPAEALIETVGRVARAASRDESRLVLNGILVTAEGDSLTMVATDSYRLSVKRTALDSPIARRFEANVPARALQELSRAAAAENAEIGITVLQNQVVFSVGGVVLSSRLIDGQFPNHEQLIPDSYEHEVRLDRTELLEVVRRVSLLAQKNAPLRLSFSEGELTVSAQTPDVGEASEALPVNFSGEGFEIGFNPDFLREGIESFAEDEILFKLITPLRPGLLQPVAGDDALYLIMPIRLNV